MKPVYLALACALALGACNKPAPSAADTPPASAAANGVAVTTDADGAAQVNLAGPGAASDMPAFAPRYPGAATVATVVADETGKHGGIYSFTTSDPIDKVMGYYKTRSGSAGLSAETNVATGGAQVYSARGPAGDLSVTAAPQGANTFVQIAWSTPAR
jgi:hypothetical protein